MDRQNNNDTWDEGEDPKCIETERQRDKRTLHLK